MVNSFYRYFLRLLLLILLAIINMMNPILVFALPLDFSMFVGDGLELSGTSATFLESRGLYGKRFSSNNYSIPTDAFSLSFDYSFFHPLIPIESFIVLVSKAPSTQMWNEESFIVHDYQKEDFGSFILDITGFQGEDVFIYIGWHPYADDFIYHETAILENIRINTLSTPIPEPVTIILFVFGLIGICFTSKNRVLEHNF